VPVPPSVRCISKNTTKFMLINHTAARAALRLSQVRKAVRQIERGILLGRGQIFQARQPSN
jgi:DNA-directed RNA polymerase subunit K/omega